MEHNGRTGFVLRSYGAGMSDNVRAPLFHSARGVTASDGEAIKAPSLPGVWIRCG